MAKVEELVLAVFGCLLTVAVNPLVLAADGNFSAQAPDFSAAEKVVASRVDEEELVDEPAQKVELASVLTGAKIAERSPVAVTMPTATIVTNVPARSYAVTTVLSSNEEYAAVSKSPSYSEIYQYGRMIFAHNTADLFGSLAGVSAGQTINLSIKGVERTYRVADTVVYDKNGSYVNNDPYFINKLVKGAHGHSFALMTCAGTALPGGDATKRLVVYIDEV